MLDFASIFTLRDVCPLLGLAVAPVLVAFGCSAGQNADGVPAFGTSAVNPGNSSAIGGASGASGAQLVGTGSAEPSNETGMNGGLGAGSGSMMASMTPVGSAGAGGSPAAPAAPGRSGGGGAMPPTSNPPLRNDADCAGQFFCDGFEDVPAGAAPAAALWKVMANYSITAQSANVQVSAENRHGGAQALRVIGAQSRNGVIASLPQTKYFLRAWLEVDAAPRGPVLIGLGTDQNSEVRLRIFNQSWATINAVPGDGVFPNGATSGNCPGCVTLTPNRWFCAEFSIDESTRSATLWIDEAEAANIVNGQGGWVTQPTAPQMFLGSMGLEGGSTGVWIDDVVAGPVRIGCD